MLIRTALTFAAASLALAASAWADEPGGTKGAATVAVVGVASEEARPDIAIVTFDTLDERPSAADAEAENAKRTKAVIEGLESSGIDTKDIATVGVSLTPLWSNERDGKTGQVVKRALTSYQASNTLSVRIRAIERTGAVIERGVQDGASYRGVGFDLSDREAREDALRVKAVQNAKHRAELYAQGAEMKLGPLQTIEANFGSPMVRAGGFAAAPLAMATAQPMPVEPGVVTLSESVSAKWALTAP